MTVVAIVAAIFIPTATSEAGPTTTTSTTSSNAELALVPGGTIAEG